jgi:hypothetical protein
MHRPIRRLSGSAFTAAVLLAVACGVATSGNRPPAGQGRLAVSLVDAPAAVSAIFVSITKVTAHSTTEGWVTISPDTISEATPLEVDLLTLQAPATALSLGIVDLPPGTVTQLRLFVAPSGNYVLLPGSDAQVPLKVPSGAQSGIKIHGPWTITACAETAVTIDFDGKRSIWVHPAMQGDEWILRPVIHVKRAAATPTGCNPACDAEHPCPEGQVCSETGICKSGSPPGEPVGAECTLDEECLTRTCGENGACAPGGANAPCQADGDCVSMACDEGSCTAPPAAGPAGSPCQLDADCLTNVCDEGSCGRGGQGATCGADTDCQEGMACTAGACAAGPAAP